MRKPLLILVSLMFLFSSCIVISPEFTKRRIRRHYVSTGYYLPMPYYGWLYLPYGYSYWYGNYGKRYYYRNQKVRKNQVKKYSTSVSKTKVKRKSITKSKVSKGSTKKSSGTRVKKK